jgi:hypothetical protein
MFNIDPKVAFWLGLTFYICGNIATAGTTFFSGALPEWVIAPLVKWCLIIATQGNGIMTYIAGANMTNAGRIANVQQVPLPQKLDSLVAHNPEVKGVITTEAVANATSSSKVISG